METRVQNVILPDYVEHRYSFTPNIFLYRKELHMNFLALPFSRLHLQVIAGEDKLSDRGLWVPKYRLARASLYCDSNATFEHKPGVIFDIEELRHPWDMKP